MQSFYFQIKKTNKSIDLMITEMCYVTYVNHCRIKIIIMGSIIINWLSIIDNTSIIIPYILPTNIILIKSTNSIPYFL